MKKVILLAFSMLLLLVGCAQAEIDYTLADLPEGDAERGAQVFTTPRSGVAACSNCHMLTEEDAGGPGLANYAEIAATRVDGQSAEEYTFDAIVHPARHLVEPYSNIMPGNYGTLFEQQEIADLIAYLLEIE